MTRLTANILLLLAGAIWGLGFVAQSTGMQHLGPFSFVAIRFTLAAALVWPFAYWESLRQAEPLRQKLSTFRQFALLGFLMFLAMSTQQVGLLTTSVSNSVTPVVAIALFRDWPHYVIWPASILALLGIHLLSGGNVAALVVGDLLTILSAVFWAIQAVLIGRFVVASGRPILLAATQFTVLALLAWLAVFVQQEVITWEAVYATKLELIYTGLFAGGIAFTFQVIAQRYTSAAQAMIFLSSEAPFAALFAALILRERIGVLGLAGCVCILVAMLMVELWPEWRRQRAMQSVANK